VVATLVRLTGDIDLAEELAQDALVDALRQWPRLGTPANPAAWLTAVGKRKAVDRFRRDRTLAVFNEGYAATAGERWVRPELCAEALRLGRVLAGLAPGDAEVHGLVALMELQSSRLAARVGPTGVPVLLADQDRRRWDRLHIARGEAALRRADALSAVRGPYALQAAIAACHARAFRPEETDWSEIVALYDELAAALPPPSSSSIGPLPYPWPGGRPTRCRWSTSSPASASSTAITSSTVFGETSSRRWDGTSMPQTRSIVRHPWRKTRPSVFCSSNAPPAPVPVR
jgi:predicted RNA polymerase sigma factor